MTNLTYYWRNGGSSFINININELYGTIILDGIPSSAKTIQIIVSNRLGESPLSNPINIVCGYKGCEDSIAGVIIAGVISSVLVLSLTIFLVFFIRRYLF